MSELKKTLSIPEWVRLSKEGIDVPVRILINGYSMQPIIRYKKDYVTIIPLKRQPLVGDIVLFVDNERERYVLHRVWKVNGNSVLTWGDNCYSDDGWMPCESLIGLVVKIERGARVIETDCDQARNSGMIHAHCIHFWKKGYHLASSIYHLLK